MKLYTLSKLTLPLAVCMIASSAFARIGETAFEIKTRYGVGADIGHVLTFSFQQFQIGVQFDDDGRCGMEFYRKADGSKVTKGECQTLLESNSDGTEWKYIFGTDYSELYETASKRRQALLTSNGLMVFDVEAHKRIEARTRWQDAASVKGF